VNDLVKNEIQQQKVDKKSNDWDIPDSDTLEPFSATPVDELPNGGRVTLLGAGPGDPDLLTVAAYRLLRDPNVCVIADRLVATEILDLIATDDIKTARKLPGCAELAQEEIYSWTHEGLKQGKHVVRLKIGDPFVFGRGGEEVLKFRRFGVEPKVVPVSSSCREKNDRKARF
jgi:uroporphyrin-III C-methyltransferase